MPVMVPIVAILLMIYEGIIYLFTLGRVEVESKDENK